jgi:hypothetical protein
LRGAQLSLLSRGCAGSNAAMAGGGWPVAGPGVGTWPDLDLAALACCLADRFLVAVVVAMGIASRALVVRELPRGEPSCHFCHVVAREATR